MSNISVPVQGFVGCFTYYTGSYSWTWNDYMMGQGAWSRTALMTKIACIEGCRARNNVLYALYNSNPVSSMYKWCYCANDAHISKFGGKKNHESECTRYNNNWVSSKLTIQPEKSQICGISVKLGNYTHTSILFQVWEISKFEPATSCGDLYFQKQIYTDGSYWVSTRCAICP